MLEAAFTNFTDVVKFQGAETSRITFISAFVAASKQNCYILLHCEANTTDANALFAVKKAMLKIHVVTLNFRATF